MFQAPAPKNPYEDLHERMIEGIPRYVLDEDVVKDALSAFDDAAVYIIDQAYREQAKRDTQQAYGEAQRAQPSYNQYPIRNDVWRRLHNRTWILSEDFVHFTRRRNLLDRLAIVLQNAQFGR